MENLLFSRIENPISNIPPSGVKPLLIIHGFLGMSDNWKSFSDKYAAQGFQVHLLDLRNHGKSFHSDAFNYDVMCNDVLQYCNHYQLNTVSIIGHSMGGKVAMLFATKYPEKVEKLVVADIGPKYYRPHHQDILAGLNAVDFTKDKTRQEVEEAIKPYVPDFGTRQFLMKSVYWKTPEQLAFRFNLPVFNKNTEVIGEALPQNAVFNKPTLFIRGENSRYILDNDWAGIVQHFPKAVLETIPNAGHWLHAENPTLFFNKTIHFLL